MKDITHIERPALPWRPEKATECGLDATRHPTWSREEAIAKSKELGRQRFAMFACMTCMSTANRHATWEHDPASCMIRHAERMTMRWGREDEPGEKRRFADELRAIAALIAAHREEFDAIVQSYADVVDLSAHRRKPQAAPNSALRPRPL